MKNVRLLSKSCGNGIGREALLALFAQAGIAAEYASAQGTDDLTTCDAIVVGMEQADAALFERAPNLKVIMKYGVGTENIDREAAEARGITVLNMPGINKEAVAEMALALMLSAARRVVDGDRLIRAGQWPRLIGTSLQGKVLGIVGTGAIGTALARLTCGLNMEIIGYDQFRSEAFEDAGGAYVAFDELVRRADFISIHVPLVESTYHMFSDREFEAMKRSAILVNTARGSVVDEQALCCALREGKIAAAGIDVYEHEPAEESPLLKIENAICLPHIAALTYETAQTMDRTCVSVLLEALGCD